ncbi:MAG: nucleotidyl transferase AbiEii/AbiGii toxin family protein [Planctomycetes bacterium]|nr:nucleotidyl transferase AbiEii/AbiGii toxin family protein [Planctomycetota bacterium]
MTDKPTTNMAASVRQRLLNLRQSSGEDYNALLMQYAIERFLYRLSKSDLADRFVLKGAMLFRVWSGAMHRPTKDVDLLGRGAPTPDAVADAVRYILVAPVPDDGLTFDPDAVVAAEIREEQEYGGIRVKLVAMLGSARIPMQIDVGFGDAITPDAEVHPYPTLLGMDAPRVRMYPPETVVAEKLEAAVTLGMTNSRMKDFYDLLVIFRTYELADEAVARAIAATFERRQTALPADVPPGLSDEFGNDPGTQRLWREFLRRLQIEDAAGEFAEVVAGIRDRIWPIVAQARRMSES